MVKNCLLCEFVILIEIKSSLKRYNKLRLLQIKSAGAWGIAKQNSTVLNVLWHLNIIPFNTQRISFER